MKRKPLNAMCYFKSIVFLLVMMFQIPLIAQELHLRVVLEGPAQNTLKNDDLMQTLPEVQLRSYGIPAPAGTVDMITVLLLNPQTNAVQHTLSGWLLKNGQVTNLVGNQVYLEAPEGTYNIIVKHRNHLPITSAKPITIQRQTILDLTNPTIAKPNSYIKHPKGLSMMIAGNVYDTPNELYAEVNAADMFTVFAAISEKRPEVLIKEDLNLDGIVNEEDARIVENHSLSLRYTTAENK